MIRISRFYEEADLADEPRWYVDDEDARRFTREPFGSSGGAWATVYGVEPIYSEGRRFNRLLGTLGQAIGLSGRPTGGVPVSGTFQLRVCSPSFIEDDNRFLTTGGRPRALVQAAFSPQAVEDFCRERVAQASPLGMQFFQALEQDFYYFDPDED